MTKKLKIFNHLVISGRRDNTMDRVEYKQGPFGPDGIWIEIDGEIITKYDFSSADVLM